MSSSSSSTSTYDTAISSGSSTTQIVSSPARVEPFTVDEKSGTGEVLTSVCSTTGLEMAEAAFHQTSIAWEEAKRQFSQRTATCLERYGTDEFVEVRLVPHLRWSEQESIAFLQDCASFYSAEAALYSTELNHVEAHFNFKKVKNLDMKMRVEIKKDVYEDVNTFQEYMQSFEGESKRSQMLLLSEKALPYKQEAERMISQKVSNSTA